jgi:hypothetical protein
LDSYNDLLFIFIRGTGKTDQRTNTGMDQLLWGIQQVGNEDSLAVIK